MSLDPVTLSVLAASLAGIAQEMGTVLVRSAYSSNIKAVSYTHLTLPTKA